MTTTDTPHWTEIVGRWANQPVDVENTESRGAITTATVNAGERRYFCKAAPTTAPGALQALRIETVATSAHRQAAAPFYGHLRSADWHVLVFDHVNGEHPTWHPPNEGFALAERIAELIKNQGGRPSIEHLPAVADRINTAPDWKDLATEHPWLIQTASKDYLIDGQAERMSHLDGTHIAHTDIHPGNIILTGDRITVVDWGWAATAPPWFDQAIIGVQLINAGVRPDTVITNICGKRSLQLCKPEALRAFAVELARYWFGRYTQDQAANDLLNLVYAANRLATSLEAPMIVREPAM